MLRGLDRVLPVNAFCGAVRSFAMVRAGIHGLIKGVPSPRRLPACFESEELLRHRHLYRLDTYESRIVQAIPDRLHEARWLDRCQISGIEPLLRAKAQGRPVVIGFFHFGPYEQLRSWIRAAGLPASFHVGGAPTIRSKLARAKDRLALFPEVPTVFYDRQLGPAIRSLKAGNPLMLALDQPAMRRVDLVLPRGTRFEMPTAAIRLAVRHHALLVTANLLYLGRWRFRLDIGEPVPHELLTKGREREAAMHLMEQVLPIFRKHPEQCRKELFLRFRDDSPSSAPFDPS
jgi:lauroyl/myristoyl acyltransferase